jgi:CubicO group peptidase (beta-lactamase class C family)
MKRLTNLIKSIRYIKLTIIALLFLVALNGYTQSHNDVLSMSQPEAAGFSSERLARLDTAMNNWVKKGWLNGSVALIARKGKIVFHKAYGYNDLITKEPLDKNGIFRIASQTKAITTVAAMMLWEEAKFSLDDPVYKFIPVYYSTSVLDKFNSADTSFSTVPANRPITIRDLLTHTSGIGYPAIGTPEENAIYAKSALTGGVGTKNQKLSDAMTKLAGLPLFFQPGQKWKYGLNTDLLGCLIEIWSGMTLEEYFTQKIFKPLGMNNTYFNIPGDKSSKLVNFFQEDSTGIHKQAFVFGGNMDMNYPLQHTNYFSGGGGLSSDIKDYAVFLQMLLNGGHYNGVRLLSRNTVRMMTMNQIGDLTVNNTENKFGFGFSIITENGSRLGPSQAGTYAWGGVFSTSYWVDPREDMVVLLYRQIWGAHVIETDKAFKPLVYQAIDD